MVLLIQGLTSFHIFIFVALVNKDSPAANGFLKIWLCGVFDQKVVVITIIHIHHMPAIKRVFKTIDIKDSPIALAGF